MFVQGKEDVSKAVHEAARGLAPDGLMETGSQHTVGLASALPLGVPSHTAPLPGSSLANCTCLCTAV